MWPILTKELYSAMKKEWSPLPATMQMNLQNIMVREISQTQRHRLNGSHLSEITQLGKSIETESRREFARMGGKGGVGMTAEGVTKDGNLELDGGGGCTTW